MVFTTHIFVFYFLPLFLLVYFNLPYRWRNLWITVASYVFYGWWEPWFVCLMMFTTVMDFIWGKVITRPGATPAQRKLAVVACVVTNLSFLGFFKYYMFSAETLNQLLATGRRRAVPRAARRAAHRHLLLHLPLADLHHRPVSRRTPRRRKSFTDFSASWRCFPTWWPGRSSATRRSPTQLAFREHTAPRFTSGIALFILGFAKKILLANPCGHVADAVFNAANPCAAGRLGGRAGLRLPDLLRLLRLLGHGGGLGRMLGFEFLKNFDAPYRPRASPTSGGAGTSRSRACCATTSTSRWAATATARAHLRQPGGGDAPGRPVARREMDFVFWGAYHGLLLAYERWRGKQSLYQHPAAALPHRGSPSC